MTPAIQKALDVLDKEIQLHMGLRAEHDYVVLVTDEIKEAVKSLHEIRKAFSALNEAGDGWMSIETAPTGKNDYFLIYAGENSIFPVRGDILTGARKKGTPSHLSLHHATHWMKFPAPPSKEK